MIAAYFARPETTRELDSRPARIPPAGWFPDPLSADSLRRWDGRAWTDVRRAGPSAANGASRDRFRADLEGLRAIAVILVVVYHVGVTAVPGGYVGVDVFFVISGFLITGQIVRELTTTGSLAFGTFYARRVRRLLVPSALTASVSAVASVYVLGPVRAAGALADARATAVYALNYRLAAQGANYLTSHGDISPLQHFWSLAVEEQFYLVWPALLFAASLVWAGRRGVDARTVARAKRGVGAALVAVTVTSFSASAVLTRVSQPWAFYSLPTRAWELAVGGLVSLTVPLCARLSPDNSRRLLNIGLAGIALAVLSLNDLSPFPGVVAALPVFSTAAVLLSGGTACGTTSRLLRARPMRWIGGLSYSWYLWHLPPLVLLPVALGRRLSLVEGLATALGTLVIAVMTSTLIERPVRRWHYPIARPIRALALAVVMASTTLLCVQRAQAALPNLQGLGQAAAQPIASSANPDAALSRIVSTSVGREQVPSDLTPSLSVVSSALPIVHTNGCHASFTQVTQPECASGDVKSPITVVLFGDSHAAMWYPAMDWISQQRHWRLVSLTKSGCPPTDVPIYNSSLKRPYGECDAWRVYAMDRISKLRPAMIVRVASRNYDGGLSPSDHQAFSAEWQARQSPAAEAAFSAEWDAAADRTILALRGTGAQVVTIGDTPLPKSHFVDCVASHLGDVRACGVTPTEAIVHPDRRAAEPVQAVRLGTSWIDPTPWFCEDRCPAVIENMLVYRDDSHVSTDYALFLAPRLATKLVTRTHPA